MTDDRSDHSDRTDTPVVLSRIYTRTGDDGTTGLGDGSRTPKTDPRLAAYADVEEANAAIGVDVGADLCAPVVPDPRYPPLRIDDRYVTRLEESCDAYNAGLEPLRSFILPGGAPGAALLHTARTVVRRAERSTWAAVEAHGDTVNPLTARYLNRLSDLLFILCRVANAGHGDILWKPGGP
jgi:cob(I)alamin adenosyltransferase